MGVPEGRPVVCVVPETATVGEGCVVCGVSGLLVVLEVLWTTGVPVTPMVDVMVVMVVGPAVD